MDLHPSDNNLSSPTNPDTNEQILAKELSQNNSEIITPPTNTNQNNSSASQIEEINDDVPYIEEDATSKQPETNVATDACNKDSTTNEPSVHMIGGEQTTNDVKQIDNTPVTDEELKTDDKVGNEADQSVDDLQTVKDQTNDEDVLKVDIPPAEGRDTSSPDGAECAGGSKPANDSESIYQIKWVYFKRKQVPIITQNENGPCPLLAIMNVLLLQNRVRLALQTEVISAGQLMTHLGDCVLQNVPEEQGVSTPTHSQLNFEQNMGDAMGVMYKLQTGLDVNVKFTGVRDFEYTTECIIFDLLQIALYHGWLVDPQNAQEVSAVGKFSYNQLVEKIISLKSSDDPELVQQALIAEQFLESSASQLTYHGLAELASQLKHDQLAVLFRNNHFTTLYRHKDELFQLVTDQGFLNEGNVVWETLSNVEGDCHFVDSNFRTYTKPEPPPLQIDPANVALTSDEQIDNDYLVALSLQQEQQQQQQWTTPPSNLSDEELAKQLQEEEQRAAMAEQPDPQARQYGTGNRQPGPPQQRRTRTDTRERDRDREQKKSDCCIL